MNATPEDKRAAVSLSTTLSGQLVQAAVAMLTVEGAYVAYALVARETRGGFEAAALLSALAFVLSVYLSGLGITQARNKGFAGDWDLSAGKSLFNLQAIALILGLGLLAVTIWLSGTSKDADLQKKLDGQTAALAALAQTAEANRREADERIARLAATVDTLKATQEAQAPAPPRPVRPSTPGK